MYTIITSIFNSPIDGLASIATLILFTLYIIGKALTSTRSDEWDRTEELTFNEPILEDHIHELNNYYLFQEDHYEVTITLKSSKTLYNIELLELNPDSVKPTKNAITFNSGISKIMKLTPGGRVIIRTVLPCGVPRYALSWYKDNYMRGIYYITYDGLRGIQPVERIEYKKTWRTFIYHFTS